ncbi:hypothetical protein KY342_00930 [Candidatus Woesearchaeota archaeon]|nr:hypothetical protein [Candidatus Woesearchaeota archaeon]
MKATLDYIMAEKEENKKYKHLKKYEKRSREADNISTHLDLTHMETYAKAAKKVLKVDKDNVEDIRQKDLTKLQETKHQIAMADEMADMYKASAKEYFSKAKKDAGEKWDLDEFDEALLIRALYGTTRQELRMRIAELQDRFNPNNFMQLKDKMMERIKDDLKAAASSHLKDSHIEDIIKYVKIEEHVDPSRVALPEAIDYLEAYIKEGTISPKKIPKKHKKPKKEEKVLKGDFTKKGKPEAA